MIEERWQSAQKIVLIRLDNLGDVLLTTPAFHAVKVSLPHASLTLLASAVGAQIGRLDPDIDDVIVYSAPWMDPWHKLQQDSTREQQMIAYIKARQFDGAIIFTSFHQSPLPAAYLCYLADIPLRAAASIDGPGSLLTTRHKHPERMMHEVERGLDLVRVLGMETTERDLVLQVPYDAIDSMRQKLFHTSRIYAALAPVGAGVADEVGRGPSGSPVADVRKRSTMDAVSPATGDPEGPHHPSTPPLREWDAPLVVVHPGCSMPARTYPWEMYVEVIDLLVRQLGALVAVTGAQDERALVTQMCEQVDPACREYVVPLAGVLSFPELCALIQVADLTITNNTGPMHIAAAVKTPVIALFALTNPPEQWGPWRVPHRQLYHDVPCRICYSRICPYQHECLRLVSPTMVVNAAGELLAEVRKDETRTDAWRPRGIATTIHDRASRGKAFVYGSGDPSRSPCS